MVTEFADSVATESRRVLIIEDHDIVAVATRLQLQGKYPDLRIVCVKTAAEAREHFLTKWFRILVDVEVPGAVGLSLVREMAALGHAERLCVVTAYNRPAWLCEARELGLLGYILKTSALAEFISSLDAVFAGRATFPEEGARTNAPPVRLTRRQQETLELLFRGFPNQRIAADMGITEGVVNNHLTALFRALRVTNRTEAVIAGIRLGLLPLC